MRSVCTVLVAASAWLGGSAAAAALLSSRALVVTKGKAVKQVALAEKHIVWEAGPLEGENSGTALLERELGTARKRVLVRSVKSSYGLALASGWVVYADGGVRGFPVFAKYRDVDTAVVTLRMTDGSLGVLTVARHDPPADRGAGEGAADVDGRTAVGDRVHRSVERRGQPRGRADRRVGGLRDGADRQGHDASDGGAADLLRNTHAGLTRVPGKRMRRVDQPDLRQPPYVHAG